MVVSSRKKIGVVGYEHFTCYQKKKRLCIQKADKEVTLPKYMMGVSLSRYRMWL